MKTYCGLGNAGEAAAQVDAVRRQERFAQADAVRAWKQKVEALERDMQSYGEMVSLWMTAMLLAAGYHKVRRTWRGWHAGKRALRAG